MTDYLWCRQIRVSLGSNTQSSSAIEIGGEGAEFNIEFDIKKNRTSSANTCNVRIYNLSEDVRRQIDNEYDRIIVEAGYGFESPNDEWPVIFDGWAKKITHVRRGVNIVSQIEGIDGGIDYANARVNYTYSPDSTYRSIISEMVNDMTYIKLGDISGIPANRRISDKRHRTFSGQARKHIESIASKFDSRMNIENGVLDIISNSAGKRDNISIPSIRSGEGMIGSPTVTEKGIQVETLLMPQIKPNSFIYVEDDLLGVGRKTRTLPSSATNKDSDKRMSSNLDGGGVYRVNSVSMTGSNRTGQFKSTIQGQKSDGYKVIRPTCDVSPLLPRLV